jgi:hypothetical protein
MDTMNTKQAYLQYESVEDFENDILLVFENLWLKLLHQLQIFVDLDSSDSLLLQIEKAFYSNISPVLLHDAIKYSLWALGSQSFSDAFMYPVSLLVTSYYNIIIKNPISLVKMEEKFLSHSYKTFRDFEIHIPLCDTHLQDDTERLPFLFQLTSKPWVFLNFVIWLEGLWIFKLWPLGSI